jgi:protein phosphatase 2C family protein 2/3
MAFNTILAGEKDRIVAAGGHVTNGRVNGNLALSRALGDFMFKKNKSLLPENQIITANPEVTVHNITEEDEFLVIACDGIWDCMSSQQVVDFIRRKISQGEGLDEIGEMLCDHCLAPDNNPSTKHLSCGGCAQVCCSDCHNLSQSGSTGIGCDNMTVLIIAILNGRTKDDWYTWITDRVKEMYGYETPRSLPEIYPKDKLKSFKARREQRDRRRAEQEGSNSRETEHFVAMNDDCGGIALLGGPDGLRGDLFRNSLLALLDRGY